MKKVILFVVCTLLIIAIAGLVNNSSKLITDNCKECKKYQDNQPK